MSTLRVLDGPVARQSDPIESYQAGENRAAREASEIAVIAALSSNYAANNHMSDHSIARWVGGHTDLPVTTQRLRTARAQLARKGLVVKAGRRDGMSPTGRAAMTWALVQS